MPPSHTEHSAPRNEYVFRFWPELTKLIVAVSVSTVTALLSAQRMVDHWTAQTEMNTRDIGELREKFVKLDEKIVPRSEHERQWANEAQWHRDVMDALRDLQTRKRGE